MLGLDARVLLEVDSDKRNKVQSRDGQATNKKPKFYWNTNRNAFSNTRKKKDSQTWKEISADFPLSIFILKKLLTDASMADVSKQTSV